MITLICLTFQLCKSSFLRQYKIQRLELEPTEIQDVSVLTINGPTSGAPVGIFKLYDLIASFLCLSCDRVFIGPARRLGGIIYLVPEF